MSEALSKLLALEPAQTISLVEMQGWSEGVYRIDESHIGAIQAAFLANRPLLVRGDPGLGKSQLAHAIASHLGWGLTCVVVHYNTVIDDLLFSVDHLERLHMANRGASEDDLNIAKFVRPGKVWRAIAPATLKAFKCESLSPHNGMVLLIDEIDKADSSLPNALLEVLDKRVISCPYLQEPIEQKDYPVFTVITSNDERLLPMAFIRRCAILDLRLAEGLAGIEQLKGIYKTHLSFNSSLKLPDEIVSEIGKWVIGKRDEVEEGEYRPGTAEYLDIIRALSRYPESKRGDSLKTLFESLGNKHQQRS